MKNLFLKLMNNITLYIVAITAIMYLMISYFSETVAIAIVVFNLGSLLCKKLTPHLTLWVKHKSIHTHIQSISCDGFNPPEMEKCIKEMGFDTGLLGQQGNDMVSFTTTVFDKPFDYMLKLKHVTEELDEIWFHIKPNRVLLSEAMVVWFGVTRKYGKGIEVVVDRQRVNKKIFKGKYQRTKPTHTIFDYIKIGIVCFGAFSTDIGPVDYVKMIRSETKLPKPIF